MRPPDPRRHLGRYLDIVGCLLLALFLMTLVEGGSRGRPWWLTAAGLVAGGASGVALWWRRSRPVQVMLITLAGAVVIQVVAPDGLFPYAGLVALHALAAARPPLVSLPAAAALLGVTSLNFRTAPAADAGFVMVFPLLVWAVGEATRTRTLAAREAALRTMSEQQAAVARELHDVIGHSVSVMVVQAAAADDVFDTRPDQARAALRAIEETGREALAELRALLPAVREGTVPRPSPRTGLDRLDDLVAPLVAAGLSVTVHREVTPGDVTADVAPPADVGTCAYRVVQESLTNTVRHAGATRADVVVRRSAAELDVEVRDDGQGAAGVGEPAAGRGLAGLRERVEQLGGRFEAGTAPGGGFAVRARLPLAPSAGRPG